MKSLHVARPSLCSLNEFAEILKPAWESGILTHNGPLVQRLEKEIKAYLELDTYIAVTSGTIALQLALQALDIKGDVIIPAFSWIATPAACNWEGCRVKFCDIDPFTLNISLESLEKAIDSRTEAIMSVHVFGNPCDVVGINEIASRHHLKVIYDAAHAFGTKYENLSILSYGDISCVSTHATKIFNTGEGGGLVCSNRVIENRLKKLRFFGYDDRKVVVDKGINGKMTEIHAGLGLANLKYISNTIAHRSKLANIYSTNLSNTDGLRLQVVLKGTNHSYFPVIFEDHQKLQDCIYELERKHIYPRRYFSPSLEQIECINKSTLGCNIVHSADVAERIICLPIHDLVTEPDVVHISMIINAVLK